MRRPACPSTVALDYFHRQIKRATDDCIIWPYGLTGVGYGYLRVDQEVTTVHVLACELTHGPRPTPGHDAAHKPIVCHNRDCFNPRHLRWATRAENMGDAVLDGTDNRGERSGAARLTDLQVAEIRQRVVNGEAQKDVLVDFGISSAHISRIINNKRRAHQTSLRSQGAAINERITTP